jgi:hypothetical protein
MMRLEQNTSTNVQVWGTKCFMWFLSTNTNTSSHSVLNPLFSSSYLCVVATLKIHLQKECNKIWLLLIVASLSGVPEAGLVGHPCSMCHVNITSNVQITKPASFTKQMSKRVATVQHYAPSELRLDNTRNMPAEEVAVTSRRTIK